MSESFDSQAGGESGRLVHEYMERAARARALGDSMLGLHLFLAAYGQAVRADGTVSSEGLSALREAWALSIQLKERSMAEYIFEKMEPTLSASEIKACTESLQNLTLDKLEQYGISRKDLQEVSEAISREMQGKDDAFVIGSGEASGIPVFNSPLFGNATAITVKAKRKDPEPQTPAEADAANAQAPAADQRGHIVPSAPSAAPAPASAPEVAAPAPATQAPASPPIVFRPGSMRYADLAGYANAIRVAKELGIGRERDPRYSQLVRELNARHGVPDPPPFDPIVITSPVREDATRFAFATVGELDLPLFRMYIEDNPQGLQALCVYVQQTKDFSFDRKTGQFEGRGILLLEDVDLWEIPSIPDMNEEGVNPFIAAQISRSLREMYNFIRAAVDNPNVFVLVTCESEAALAPFFLDLLEPFRVVPVDLPTSGERASVWMELVREHPSLNGLSVATLVKNSANLGRYEIYMAVNDALDESYREDLNNGYYRPVRASRIFEKLAAYQPLDSEEYKTLEEAVVSDFRRDLAHIDDLLDS